MATLAQHELNARSSNDALLLNSGLFGTHARSSSFSTHLSGRFYKNSTLAAHAARKKRAARMRAKKRELEQAIMLEERRAELLEERLRERKEQCLRIQRKRQEAALDIQCWIRQRFASQRVDSMRRCQAAMNQISVFCQARYRGLKGREVAHARRREVAQQRRENDAAIQIQCKQRCRAAKKVAESKRKELEKQRYASACTIQAFVRTKQCRRRYLERLQEKQRLLLKCQEEACTKIQSIHRRNIALQEADRYRAAKKKATEEKPDPKPKRVPLHMRRYSTYAVAQVASIASIDKSRRRSSVIGLTAPNISRQQRRSSCPGVALATPADTTKSGIKSSQQPLVEASVSEPSATTSVAKTKTDKSTPQPNLVEEARRRASARVHIAKRERKSKNPHDDERDKARALRTRVASFEEKRRRLISTTRKKKNKKKQLSPSVDVDREENTERACDGGCPTVEPVEERCPPQDIASDQSGPRPPCTSSTVRARATCTNQNATSGETVPGGSNFPRKGDGEPKRKYMHQKHREKPPTRENKEEPQVHEHISATFETDSDAKFDSFSEHEDDLG